MNNFSENYEVILKTLKTIEPNINFLNQIRIPKLADIELITVPITAEFVRKISKQLQIKGFVPHKKCTFLGINYMRFVL